MPAKGKCRSEEFQNRIDNFTDLLHEAIGLQKSGKPEAKRQMRHGVCPECDMKYIALKARCEFPPEYLFPCIHEKKSNEFVNRNLKLVTQVCPLNIVSEMLAEIKNKDATYFDISCKVNTNENMECTNKKIALKPLQKNTWDRNNQPRCDNIRITATPYVFVTIEKTKWGNIELHIKGCDMIRKKPYSRLGTGINMVSGKHWVPGLMYMITDHTKLEHKLEFTLKYPTSFQGKINIEWPKKNSQSSAMMMFKIDTTKMNINMNMNVNMNVNMNMKTNMNTNMNTNMKTNMNTNVNTNINEVKIPTDKNCTMEIDQEMDVDVERETSSLSRRYISENFNSESDMLINDMNEISDLTDMNDSDKSLSYMMSNNNDSIDDNAYDRYNNENWFLSERSTSNDELMEEEEYLCMKKSDELMDLNTNWSVEETSDMQSEQCCTNEDVFKPLSLYSNRLADMPRENVLEDLFHMIETDNLINFRYYAACYEKEYLYQMLFESEGTFPSNKKIKGTCLHVIAFYQRLSFYQYLESVYTPEEVLKQFCTKRSPSDNKVPFQLACMRDGNDLLDYTFARLKQCVPEKKNFYKTLQDLLRRSDWSHDTIFMYLVCFEKVNMLKHIYEVVKEWPWLLSASDFTKECRKDTSITMIMHSQINMQEICLMKYCNDWEEENQDKHFHYCEVHAVVEILIKIREQVQKYST